MTESDVSPARVINVRIDVRLLEQVDAAATVAGVSRSEWVRDALEAGVNQDRAAIQRALGFRKTDLSKPCVHPRPAWNSYGAEVRCAICGQVVRRLL